VKAVKEMAVSLERETILEIYDLATKLSRDKGMSHPKAFLLVAEMYCAAEAVHKPLLGFANALAELSRFEKERTAK
jgi:hypothetical protein